MKNSSLFECIECGFQGPKYYGRCPQCQAWNSFVESAAPEDEEAAETIDGNLPQKISEINPQEIKRLLTGMDEFDRVLGGGIVAHSVILIGGEPGVGKSTLLLEVSAVLSEKGKKVLYYSGEESAVQIKIRAERLAIHSDNIYLFTIGTLEDLQRH
ncbi:MAG: ATPase domain-containing protein, partial [Chrysiogenales bacterium]